MRNTSVWSDSDDSDDDVGQAPSVSFFSPLFRRYVMHRRECSPKVSSLSPQKVTKTRPLALFALSNTIGTILFFLVFYPVLAVFEKTIDPTGAYTLAYAIVYCGSIVWQHYLNALLVFTHHTDSKSLHQTASIYLFSFAVNLALGSLLIAWTTLPSSIVLSIQLLTSGLLNFVLLTRKRPRIQGIVEAY